MVAVKLDFSLPTNVQKLRTFLNRIVGDDTPILFSLLGNTLANFTDDQKLLESLAETLLTHDEDRLLLEVATSSSLSEEASRNAEMEYRGTPLFLDWVTSALTTHTNLAIDHEAVDLFPSVEAKRALVLKVVYANTSADSTLVKLANGTQFSFRPEDTIRLELTRKYHPDAVTELLNGASLSADERRSTELPGDDGTGGFGLELVLARRDPDARRSNDGRRVRIFRQSNG